MRLLGYCIRCHKFKHVTVRVPNHRGVQIGVCADCEDER